MIKLMPVVLVLLALPAMPVLAQTGGEIPDGLKALKNPDPKVRLKSVALLVDLGPIAKFALGEVKECLKDEDAKVRVKAAECVFGLEPDAARSLIPVLTDALKGKDGAARVSAATVLGKFGKNARSAVPQLIDALKEKDVDLRMETALALGEIGPGAKKAVAPLLEIVREEDGDFLEPTVAVSLSRFGPEAVAEIVEALADKHVGIRRASCVALGLIGPEASEGVNPLTERLKDQEPSIRAAAVQALGTIGGDAKKHLAKIAPLLKEENLAVRINVALALWRLDKQTEGVVVLRAALKDKNGFVREQACRAVVAMGKAAQNALPELIGTLSDPEPKIRALSADALAGLEPSRVAVAELNQSLKDVVPEVRLRAARALFLAYPERRKDATEWFAANLKAESTSLRLRTVDVVGDLGKEGRALAPDLLPLLRDPLPVVRRSAATALKKIDPDAAAKAGIR